MSVLSDRWRKRADELNEALPVLLGATGVVPAVVQAAKAAVVPELLKALADMVDGRNTTPETDTVAASANRNNLVRMAAIKGVTEGKWDDLDRYIDSLGTDSGSAAKPGDGTNT